MSRTRLTPILLSCSLALSLTFFPSKARSQDSFTTIDVPGATETDANDINKAGSVVGFYVDSAAADHGFLLRNGHFSFINFPGATSTLAYGINDLNQIVGWYVDASGVTHGYLFSSGKFTSIDVPGSGGTTECWSISNSGEIVGTYTDSSGVVFHGFTDVNGNFTTVDVGTTLSQVTGINRQGVLVGIFFDNSGNQHGFQDVNGKFTTITYPGATITSAARINTSGEIVGLYGSSSTGPFSGYFKVRGVYTTIMFPGSTETRVRGLNDAGIVVGRYTDVAGVIHGFEGHP